MHVNTAAAISTRDSDPATSGWRNPLNLLILGGILLIAAIAVGTVVTIVSFRQRALVNSERVAANRRAGTTISSFLSIMAPLKSRFPFRFTAMPPGAAAGETLSRVKPSRLRCCSALSAPAKSPPD